MLCECGCGRTTPVARKTDSRWGHVKAKHMRFVRGHGRERSGVEYVVADDGCWIWQGKSRSGAQQEYGLARRGERRGRAHRVIYEELIGPIPEGCELHHRCGQKLCVNPAHLEAVTRKEHVFLGRDGA